MSRNTIKNPSYEFHPRKASMGLPPGVPLDRPRISRFLEEAKQRDMFVWGTVSSGSPNSTPETVTKTFGELLEMGVDGFWLSFDDAGQGESMISIIESTIAFGKEHGITGDRLMTTPMTLATKRSTRHLRVAV